jgi:hypothetical protein
VGLFNDYNNTNRTTWRYTYTAAELTKFALQKYFDLEKQEHKERNEIATLLQDVGVKSTDHRINDLKKSIEKLGSEKEQCMIWVHEFKRNCNREYHLQLGDVSYFNIAQPPLENK